MGVKRSDYPRYSGKVTRSRRWQVLRAAVLERDGFECRSCGAHGRLEIDHVQPVRNRPDLSFDPANCQALCPACHSRKTRLEVGHKPAPEDRLKWRESVTALERGDENPKHEGDSQC